MPSAESGRTGSRVKRHAIAERASQSPDQHVTDPLGAVLCDMDGTLLDSEKVWDVSLDDLAHFLGGELSAAARARMVGTPLGRSVAILHDDLGIDADPETSAA